MRRWGALVVVAMLAAGACSSGGSRAAETGNTGDTGDGTRTATVRVVDQNLLHGTACPTDSDRCDLPARVALFLRQLTRAGCPEVVAIEEANETTVTELRKGLDRCGYDLVWDDDPGQDREALLTTLPVRGRQRLRLAGPLRTALRVWLGGDAGPVEVVATHLASSSDDRPCDAATCPPPCAAADSVNTCQARQIAAALAEDPPPPRTLVVVTGDLNATPDEPTLAALTASGLVDTHLEIGNPECDPTTGTGCTSGRIDDALTDMRDPTSRQTERIDYVLVRPTARCRIVRPTGVFAPQGGPVADDGIVFPADHSAVEASLRCTTTSADRAAGRSRRGVPSSTTTTPEARVSAATRAAVTAAFEGLFAPNPDADEQLANLEDAAALRDSFIARKQTVGPLADRTSVRIDSFDGASDDTVDVTFSILLDGEVVLDALAGRATRVDGRWLVSVGTYCQVATLGVDDVPEACSSP